ncbi:Primary amine oxidase 2 [Camellia lanceoleosa]|uniref:Primary amine oxidase 2 n=1 Tax=Camellia lanceoleosa TaxID=1840588 RepID=A0ACC0FCH6_9ERIC|nr:Primary amine oxidase 2 [Camellia lanceoleosa]
MQICLQKVYFCFGYAFKSACRRFTSVLVKLFLISFLFISFTFVLAVRNKHRIENIKIVHVFVKSGLRTAVGFLLEYYESHFQILIIEYFDRFTVPVAKARGTEYRAAKQKPPFGPPLKGVTTVQPDGSGIEIDGHTTLIGDVTSKISHHEPGDTSAVPSSSPDPFPAPTSTLVEADVAKGQKPPPVELIITNQLFLRNQLIITH